MIEDIGMDGLKKHIQKEYKREFRSEGNIILEKGKFEEYEELNDGTYSYAYHTDFSRLCTKEIKDFANFAIKNGSEIRIGIDQNIYLLGLHDKSLPFSSAKQSSTVVACAGNLCPYAVWSIKDETAYTPLEKFAEHQITVGFSGCAKGCGRHYHSDIGLIGLKTNNFGDTDGGARIFLGAEHSLGKSTARMIFSMVPFVHLHDTLSLIITIFEKSDYTNFEEYSKNILNKYSAEFLAIWYLANIESKQSIALQKLDKINDFEFEKAYLLEKFSQLKSLQNIEDRFFNTISSVSKKLWTVEGKDPHYVPPMKRVNIR